MTEKFANWFAENLSFLPPELAVFIVSMVPILELRGGIIVAALLELPYWKAIILSFFGNILPIPFVLLFIRKILEWMKNVKIFRKIALWVEKKADKHKEGINKKGILGLTLFVGIPLPGTGAWTGSLIAALLHMDLKKAILSILMGLVLATVIMMILCYTVPELIFG